MKRWWALMGLGVAVTMGPAPSLADEPMVRETTSTFRASPTAASIAALVKSDGYYRIPYADGTKVKVNRNHDAHTPRGRYDMVGTGGSKPYRIVAAAPGRIVAIEDSFSAKQDSATASQCNNNYVWIEHPNGEWSKYSHMQKGSTTGKAKLKVGDSVTAGQYLGDEGSVGCARGDHLHFEIGRPRASDPITSVGGFLRDNADSNRNRIARICGVSGGAFQSGKTYQARSVPAMLTPGSKEVARHGLPIRDYQCLYDQARTAKYEPVLLDMFDVGGETYVNAVFRPKTSGAVRAFHGLTAARYQAEFDKAKADGYRPVIIESYLDGGVRYAAVFKQTSGVPYSAYHGRTVAQHDERVADLKAKGYVPVSVSVVSDGGRKYTALWEKRSVGWELKSQLTPAQYQTLYDSNKAAGRHVAFLNGYEHAGNPYIAAIFTSSTPAGGKQRHGMTGAKYQTEWSSAMGSGLSTRTVTGYATGNTRTYAASWR
jgi:hypothetical protein